MAPDVYVVPVGGNAAPPQPGVAAFSTPSFIIKDGDTYWVSLAVIPYRAADAENDVQLGGCAHIKDLFDAGVGLEAVERPSVSGTNWLAEPSDQSTPDHR